ncbi:Na(+)-translocating NADH-quinone reductase subunit A [Saccharophagus sp. K07]|jgi:Na+-transporting NADH:ubiquinone oxidoreductase subunit A|uniref:Na(+)-translocating NADH-quinone reductase subunit A n=1 Tax=Saccharophagus sp. K07 TaxID=2283636 RepID=UPI0016520A4F|nr:Na(+)-translocating NADH-quinone reductase subunit A [Saccharophagus sp. K07]MBC6904720.1 Na(+)-translocating NADH-quinone reductase subunit A [Saccharophagus sp. K07]
MIKIRKGLDLPITGGPKQTIEDGPKVRSVAVIGFDYHGMKPSMAVAVGDRVKRGQVLFSDKKTPGVVFTAPASGTVSAIHRGAQRVFQSLVIDVEGDDYVEFDRYSEDQLAKLDRQAVQDNLVKSGLWTAFRTRPFSKTPALDTTPNSIFVTAMDTNPLAADPQVIIAEKAQAFSNGLTLIARLLEGKVFVCHAPEAKLPKGQGSNIVFQAFSGVHPAGNAGTHIHFLDPVSAKKTVWTIGYQDVIAIGELFVTGQLPSERVISLAGPQVANPRLVRTRLGASLEELTAGQLKEGENRVISGSVFGGRFGGAAVRYLGRFHNQVSVLREGRDRTFLHYLRPGLKNFSVLSIYVSKLLGGKFDFTTSTNGSERAMVPVGSYERVMPLDILPTQLLRSLIVGDTETAQQLGCLELDEEDLALCTFVCPGKYEYGPILRKNLTRIELEG